MLKIAEAQDTPELSQGQPSNNNIVPDVDSYNPGCSPGRELAFLALPCSLRLISLRRNSDIMQSGIKQGFWENFFFFSKIGISLSKIVEGIHIARR